MPLFRMHHEHDLTKGRPLSHNTFLKYRRQRHDRRLTAATGTSRSMPHLKRRTCRKGYTVWPVLTRPIRRPNQKRIPEAGLRPVGNIRQHVQGDKTISRHGRHSISNMSRHIHMHRLRLFQNEKFLRLFV